MTNPAPAATAPTNAATPSTVVTEPQKPAPAPANGAPVVVHPETPAASAPPKVEPAFDLKLPEGSHLDPGAVERIVSFAKEQGLSKEQAQGLLNREDAAVAAYVTGEKEGYVKEQKAWMDSLKADKEIGGVAFDESVALAKRAVDTFGTDAFKKALNETGLGNHPELVRVFARIGRNMADDKIVRPGSVPAAKKSPEQVFYPDTPSKEA